MPKIYLSPSTQDWNMYVTNSGSEEYNSEIARPWCRLRANGIQYRRNRPEMTAGSSIRDNSGDYDLYLALHSNAAPEGRYGQARGIIAFYYPGSAAGERAAELIAENLRDIYPLPDKVTTRSTTSLGRCASPGSRLCWRRSATTTTTPTPSGWRPPGRHRPADRPGPDGVLRPALHLPHGPGAGDGPRVRRHAEPAGAALPGGAGHRQPSQRRGRHQSTASGRGGMWSIMETRWATPPRPYDRHVRSEASCRLLEDVVKKRQIPMARFG